MRYTLVFLCLFLPLFVQSADFDIIILDQDLEPAVADGWEFIHGTDVYQRMPDLIIGDDDFEKMLYLPPDSPDYILGQKVGLFVIPQRFNPTRYWFCTGFLVGPDLFLTNHHCIHEKSELLPIDGALIFMDYYRKSSIDPTRGGVTAGVSAVLHSNADKDYALLRLDRPIGNTYGWLELDATTQVDSTQSVKIIQHPRGRSKEIARRNSQIVDIPENHPLARSPFALAYLADTEGGSSGSPVFLKDGNSVIAIHHSFWTHNGSPHFNAGTLMSHILPEIQQWLPPSGAAPDLSVSQLQLSNGYALPGESLALSLTVRNQGTAASPATMLRFYQSIDSEITASDLEVGSFSVVSLRPKNSIEASVTLTAPLPGTYYYGACVDTISGDSRSDNDCSTAATLTVSTTELTRMYWIDLNFGLQNNSKVQRANTDGSNVETLVTWIHGLQRPLDISLDTINRKVYWVDDSRNVIQRANLDGKNVEDIVTGLDSPNSIALDVAGSMIYYVDRNGIHRANLDGSNVEFLANYSDKYTFNTPSDIALDMISGKIYSTGEGVIVISNLNGSDIEYLVTELTQPTNIALDVAGGKMYWTDWDANVIQRANLDGSDIEYLVTSNDGLAGVSGIALDVAGGKMYWTDWGADVIQRANLDGSNIETLITKGLTHVIGIALDLPEPESGRPIQLSPNAIDDQSLTVGIETTVVMPVAHGGTPTYAYSLSPNLSPGLQFDQVNRKITGTPTDATPTTTYTYIATDASNTVADLAFTIEVVEDAPSEPPDPPSTVLDVNGDGKIDVLDLVWVAMYYGKRGDDLSADVNNDGIVNVQDFILVAEVVDAELAEDIPVHLIEEALWEVIDNIAGAPSQPPLTILLPNYPNPFNPETWIPYTLSSDDEVVIEIYTIDGKLVRRLEIGHQSAGVYVNKTSAAYWDGKNEIGESVASGLYFYTLTAGEFTATRKMLIRK